MILPVILAGGGGTRLWPISHATQPKQFSLLPGFDLSLFQYTVQRLDGALSTLDPLIICNDKHLALVTEQLRQMNKVASAILLEPCAKNTAPAVALSALYGVAFHDDPVLLILPSDQLIKKPHNLNATFQWGAELAAQGGLTTFGIVPDVPNTQFGYIKCGEPLPNSVARQVAGFVEKPDLDMAKAYLSSGRYLFNSGMFMFRASTYLAELKAHAPSIHRVCEQTFSQLIIEKGIGRIPASIFDGCPSESIDRAVFEKTQNAAVVPLDAGWSDLGSWKALWDAQAKDANGNFNSGNVFTSSVSNSFINSATKPIVAIGLNGMLIAETAAGVLVANVNNLDEATGFIRRVNDSGAITPAVNKESAHASACLSEHILGRSYEIEHIKLATKEALVRQLTSSKSSHCIVIKGRGAISVGGKVTILLEKDSFLIPAQEVYTISNAGDGSLECIEIRTSEEGSNAGN